MIYEALHLRVASLTSQEGNLSRCLYPPEKDVGSGNCHVFRTFLRLRVVKTCKDQGRIAMKAGCLDCICAAAGEATSGPLVRG